MIELYQAEWCPFSHLVRQRLTELMVPFVAHQVEPEPEDRAALVEATGGPSIPALVLEDGTVVAGDTEEIIDQLEQRFDEGPHTRGHVERRVEARTFER